MSAHAENTRSFRMAADTHTKIAAVAAAESRTMTSQLDLIVDDWLDSHGYSITRNGRLKRETVDQ